MTVRVVTSSQRDGIRVTVRYFAAAKAAAGITEETLDITGDRLSDVLAAVARRHGPTLVRVLDRCSFLIDEIAAHGADSPVRTGTVVDVLPPFAGG